MYVVAGNENPSKMLRLQAAQSDYAGSASDGSAAPQHTHTQGQPSKGGNATRVGTDMHSHCDLQLLTSSRRCACCVRLWRWCKAHLESARSHRWAEVSRQVTASRLCRSAGSLTACALNMRRMPLMSCSISYMLLTTSIMMWLMKRCCCCQLSCLRYHALM